MTAGRRDQAEPGPPDRTPTALFCLRADSDVDHVVPVVDALARRGAVRIRLVVYDPIKTFRSDYRLRYLGRQHGIIVKHLLDLPAIGSRRRLSAALLRGLFGLAVGLQRRVPSNRVSRLFRPLLGRLQRALKQRCASAVAIAALVAEIETIDRGIVVFDHTINPLAEAATAAARRRGLATLALPHSIPHLSDLPRDAVIGSADGDRLDWGALYDRVALPNAPTAERFAKDCLDRSLLVTLGSPRFSQSWGRVLDGIAPRFDWNPGGRRVLFILSKKGPYVNWPEVERVSLALSGDPRLAVVLKPHPRTEVSGLPAIHAGPRVRIAPAELPTASLIHWADLVVFWGSSVIYDAIRLRKPVLHLAYLFRLHFDFEPYLRSWAVNGFEDFEVRLERFLAQGGSTYNEEEARHCLETLVESPDSPTLERYADLLEDLLAGEPGGTAGAAAGALRSSGGMTAR